VTTKASQVDALKPQPPIRRVQTNHLRLAAPGKINLNLLVGPRRGDGYHPIDSYVARITLYDLIDIRRRRDGAIVFSCQGADCGDDDANLALLAARALAEGRSVPGAHIALRKSIPPGSGLGGASSDGAAVLNGLNVLWELSLPPEALAELAGRLGSDVPLFLGPPASRITGRGEQIQPLPVHPFLAVMYLPAVACQTSDVYAAYDRDQITVDQQLDAGLLQQAPSAWRGRLRNHLAPAALRTCRQLGDIWDALSRSIPQPVCLTGSGSGLFVLCDDPAEVRAVLACGGENLVDRRIVVQQNTW